LAGNNSLELEIHNLFQEGNTLETICGEVLSKYEKSDGVSPSEAEGVSHFLMTAGRIDLLFKFYLKCLKRNSLGVFPWGCLAEAVKTYKPELDEDLIDIIEFGLENQKNEESSHRSEILVNSIPVLHSKIHHLKKEFEVNTLQLKTKLMAQLNHNRLYQLSEQEEQTLYQLIKIFPSDLDVKLLHQAHLEKKADEILARVKNPRNASGQNLRRTFAEHNAETQDFIDRLSVLLLDLATRLLLQSPEQIYNLAILAMQFELYELSLELLNKAPVTISSEWLKAEMLLEAGRHLELLKHIEAIEKNPSANAETTYGAIYLKAQAYFGLGQKEIALRLLESLSDKVPNYRSTQALIHEWKFS
jgi:tetratricopeptide (TPR) repeat protein